MYHLVPLSYSNSIISARLIVGLGIVKLVKRLPGETVEVYVICPINYSILAYPHYQLEPHKAVAEVSKIETYRKDLLL